MSDRPLLEPAEIEARGLVDLGNGFLLDPETGEVIENRKTPFRVRDLATAEFVVRRRQERDAEIVKQLTLFKAQCEPILAALRAAIRERDWWKARYDPELEVFAAQQIEVANAGLPEKKRTSNFRTAYGRLQFGTSPKMIDIPAETMPDAIKWAEQFVPEAVQKTLLKKPLEAHEEILPPAYFDVLPPRVWFAVQTGVSVPPEAEKLAKLKI